MNLDKKTVKVIESVICSLKTDEAAGLFQLITHAAQLSRFVHDVISHQPEQVVLQCVYHKNNGNEHFLQNLMPYLQQQLFSNEDSDNSSGLGSDSESSAPTPSIPTTLQYQASFRDEVNIMTFLRTTRKQHSAAIAILEMNQCLTIEESMFRMSQLSEVLIQIAYQWSYASISQTFGAAKNEISSYSKQNLIIVAMGKLGGFELNFSSDIDLIFFYSTDGETVGGSRKLTHARFFQKVGVLLIKLLNEISEDGFVFRVDMRLRPYGDSGSLVMSLSQAEDYYQDQGRGWERFAMVRARIITGDSDEKDLLEKIIKPFAFRRYIDYGVIDSLRNMKQMIQREVRRRGLTDNIKLGAGGIREIEFMVQSLQLIQGGRDKRLQEKSLLKVLPLLVEEKLLPQDTCEQLASNYKFLRRLENYLQELEEKQTQQLPTENNQKDIITQLMGFKTWSGFKQVLDDTQANTHQHFNALFGEDNPCDEIQNEFYLSLWENHISDQQLVNENPNLSAKDANAIIEVLQNFRQSNLLKNLSSRGAKRLKRFFPYLLSICLQTADSLQTLNRLLIILRAILKRTAYLELLSENPPVLRHLVELVSKSDWIVKRLSDYPVLFDELLYPNSLYEPLKTQDLQNELRQYLLRIDENDEEQLLDTLRQFKQINELRVAAALLSERLSISQVSRYLTQIAEVIIQSTMQLCWKVMVNKYGAPKSEGLSFVVVAYGKLGGYELAFNSDLDLVFLFDKPLSESTSGIANGTKNSIGIVRFYTRFAQKLIHYLSTRTSLGILYEVDMRLRPSGNSGLLVSHIDAFADYQVYSAWTWEHQALVRARVVAGDPLLAKQFSAIRHQVLLVEREDDTLKKDIVKMREKMRDGVKKNHNQSLNLKQCPGGMIDIEFIAQYFALSMGNKSQYNKKADTTEERAFFSTNTVELLKLAQQRATLDSEDSRLLIKCYRAYRNFVNHLAIVDSHSGQTLSNFKQMTFEVEKAWIKYLL